MENIRKAEVPIRILEVHSGCYPYVIGGIEQHITTLVNEIKDVCKVDILIANNKPKTEIEKVNNTVITKVASFGKIFSNPVSFLFPLWLKRMEADIFHFHHPFPVGIISFFLVRPKGKLVITYHGDIMKDWFFCNLFKPIEFLFLYKADILIAYSHNLVRTSFVLRHFAHKCIVIPNGIDLSKYELTENMKAESEAIRKKYGPNILLYVGRLVRYKGARYLIQAMKQVNAKLIIIGEGPQRHKLEAICKDRALTGKVFFMGAYDHDHIASYYHACKAFVLPSIDIRESYGSVILEAQACGKPVITSNLPTGVSFLNIDKVTGLLVPRKDPQALADAINKLLNDKKLCDELGRNGLERARQDFTKEKMAERTLDVFKNLAARKT